MRVLILGCGYVGGQVAFEMARAGHEVWGVRRNPDPIPSLAAAGVRFLAADLTSRSDLASLDGPWDQVVFCASSTQGGVEDYRRVYLDGMGTVLAWLGERPPRALVYTSSTGVYAQDHGEEVTEASPAGPGTGTTAVLLEAERHLLDAAAGGFPGMVLRVSGIYGPGRGYWLRQFLAGEARLDGTGDRWLNMVHRDDVAGAVQAALVRGQPGAVYNVSDNEPVRQRDLFAWLAVRVGRPMPPPSPPGDGPRKRPATSKRISNRRLRTELGYSLRFPTFREGYEAELARLNRAGEP